MTNLNYEHEQFIIKKLACGHNPAEVTEELRKKFLLDVSSDAVAHYNPERPQHKELPPFLLKLFHQTRREHRAGKEKARKAQMEFVVVAETSELEANPTLCIEKKGKQIALFKQNGNFFAIDNRCTHQGGSLCEGTLKDGEIECPLHGSHFEIGTGEATAPPAVEDVNKYNVRVRSEKVEVEL